METTKSNHDPSRNDKPIFRSLSEVEKRKPEWLWNQRIPKKCITLLEGDGGIGKSMAISAIVASITTGQPLPESESLSPVNVLLLALEDDPEVVLKPRYEQHGADCARVFFYDQTFTLNPANLKHLEQVIVEKEAELVVIDPVVAYFNGEKDTNSSVDVRIFMNGLHEIAKRNNAAILCVRHWNKNSSATASQRGSGSVDFRNAARSVLQVIKNGNARYLALEKSNYAAQAKTLEFKIEDGVLRWGNSLDKTADELLSEINDSRSSDLGQLDEALMFLDTEIGKGPVLSRKLIDSARDFGLSDKVLKRARKERGVVSWQIRECGASKWLVGLPEHRALAKSATSKDPGAPEVPVSRLSTSDPLGLLGVQSEFVL